MSRTLDKTGKLLKILCHKKGNKTDLPRPEVLRLKGGAVFRPLVSEVQSKVGHNASKTAARDIMLRGARLYVQIRCCSVANERHIMHSKQSISLYFPVWVPNRAQWCL